MRRAQKTHRWQQKPQLFKGQLWFPPYIEDKPVHGPQPLAHKFERVLKRLAKGGEKLLKAGAGAWYWTKGSKLAGKVKSSILYAMHAAGLAQCIGGQWLITADGRKAIGLA